MEITIRQVMGYALEVSSVYLVQEAPPTYSAHISYSKLYPTETQAKIALCRMNLDKSDWKIHKLTK